MKELLDQSRGNEITKAGATRSAGKAVQYRRAILMSTDELLFYFGNCKRNDPGPVAASVGDCEYITLPG